MTEYAGQVVAAAVGGSYAYDGDPHGARVSVTGLPAGYAVKSASSGATATHVSDGEVRAAVDDLVVVNAQGEDVTADLDILKVDGTIEINPRKLLVATGGASKEYDGTALTDGRAVVLNAVAGEGVAVSAAGSQTDVGSSENAYAIDWGRAQGSDYAVAFERLGTLEVTANASPVTFVASSASKAYDGSALESVCVSAEGLPSAVTYEAKAAGSQTDAGSSPNAVASYRIVDASGKDVTSYFSNVATAEGALVVTPAPLSVTTPSASKEYDGTPLAAPDGASLEGLVAGETATVAAIGSQTDVGSSANTYAIDWNGTAKESNYEVASESLGTLAVTANASPVTVTAASASKTYDGAPLEAAGAEVEGLPDGITAKATASGSRTDAGTSDSAVASYAFYDASGKDVTSYFSNVSTAEGALTVEPAPLSVATESASKAYDGTPLAAGGSLEGLVAGETATFTATGSQTEVGSSANTYEIAWDGTARESNYQVVSESLGTLTVTAATPVPTPDSDGTDGGDGQEPTGSGSSGSVSRSVDAPQPPVDSCSTAPETGDAPLGVAAGAAAVGALCAARAAFRRARRPKH